MKISTCLIALFLQSIISTECKAKELMLGYNFLTNGMLFEITSLEPYEVKLRGLEKDISYFTEDPIIIPAFVGIDDGRIYSVTAIDDYALSKCHKTPMIVMPNSIRVIGRNAFANCCTNFRRSVKAEALRLVRFVC